MVPFEQKRVGWLRCELNYWVIKIRMRMDPDWPDPPTTRLGSALEYLDWRLIGISRRTVQDMQRRRRLRRTM